MNPGFLRRLGAWGACALLAFSAVASMAAEAAKKAPMRSVSVKPTWLTQLDSDTGPTFSFAGKQYANQRAYIESGARCGTRELSGADMARNAAASRAFAAQRALMGLADAERPPASVVVPVYVHVIRRGTSVAEGNVPDSWVTAQMQVLNDAWGGPNSPFRFQLIEVTRTTNAAWYDMAGEAAELAAKTALKRGGPETLNIYVADLSGGLLGYAYYAEDAQAVGVLDGVVVLNASLPGGNAAPYNLGDTATHEVGHWFGLAHTFEGGCSRTNDLIADTSPEASPAFGCPIGRNSCRSTRVGDPIFNFMDYTDDACMNNFTRLQFVRMDDQHLQYRTPQPAR